MSDTKPSFTITRADHTGITVSSLEESLHFWVDVLGFPLVSKMRFENGALIENIVGVKGADLSLAAVQAPGHLIELIEYHSPSDRQAMKPRSCDVGSVHIAFMVEGLDALLNRIEKAGWHKLGTPQMIEDGPRGGTRLIYVRGPDGVTLEFLELPTKA